MNPTESERKISTKATVRPWRRLGVLVAGAAVAVAAWTGPGAVSGLASQRHAQPSSGYTRIDTSDHPTNPMVCRYGGGC